MTPEEADRMDRLTEILREGMPIVNEDGKFLMEQAFSLNEQLRAANKLLEGLLKAAVDDDTLVVRRHDVPSLN